MRSETNGLRAQTTTSPLGCEVCNTQFFTRTLRRKTARSRFVSLLRVAGRRVDHRYHGCAGQEPLTRGSSTVDVFWKSCCSRRATHLLRAGWHSVFVRDHPDSSLLQSQDSQC